MLDKQKWKALLKNAKKGDADAQVEVGVVYAGRYIASDGEVVVKQNNRLACKWYEMAAEQGNAYGMDSLAFHLNKGIGCERDQKRAIRLHKLAIDKGLSDAAYNLGTIYRDRSNYKKAFEYYTLAMGMEKSSYSFKVGLCLYYGIGVKQDKALAVGHLRKVSAEKQGTHFQYEQDLANYYLGLSYLTGDGVGKSLKSAKKYLELANIDNDNEPALQLTQLIGESTEGKRKTNKWGWKPGVKEEEKELKM